MPPAPAAAPWAPMPNLLDVPRQYRPGALELPAPPEMFAAAPAPAPLDESPAARAARYGYVLLPDGQYVEAHRAPGPHVPPYRARFAVGYQPADDPRCEGERWRQRTAAALECSRKLGPRPGAPVAAPPEAPGPEGPRPGDRRHDRPQAPRPGLYLVNGSPPAPVPGWGWHGGASCRPGRRPSLRRPGAYR